LAANETSAGKQKTCPRCQARVTVPDVVAAGGSVTAAPARRSRDHALLMAPMRSAHRGDLIDMTAMVDIVFFLLIFFLVTSMHRWKR
jgi:hypothetical protein